MEYFVLTNQIEDEEQDAILSAKYKSQHYTDYNFEAGQSFAGQMDVPVLVTLYEDVFRGKMNDHLSIGNINAFVISLKVKLLLQRIGISSIEYYPLVIIDEHPEDTFGVAQKKASGKGIKFEDYYIANVISLVDCVDHEKSSLEYFYPPELRSNEAVPLSTAEHIEDPFAGENLNDIDLVKKLVLAEGRIDPSLKI